MENDQLAPPISFQPAAENKNLTQKLVEQLRQIILDGTLAPSMRLPNEPSFSEQLNVSRATLRAALQILEREGFIIRRRGLGTFVAEKPIKVNNLNLNWGVTEVIRSTGAVPGTIELMVVTRPASEHVARRLNIEPGSPMIVIERVRTANNRRVVFSVDHIPCDWINSRGCVVSVELIQDYLSREQSFYSFLREHLNFETHHAIAWISPMTADKLTADKLQVPIGTGILYLEQVEYTPDERPIVLADEYHLAGAFTFAVYRTR